MSAVVLSMPRSLIEIAVTIISIRGGDTGSTPVRDAKIQSALLQLMGHFLDGGAWFLSEQYLDGVALRLPLISPSSFDVPVNDDANI